jgi:very-short-patch-repair endonuclease
MFRSNLTPQEARLWIQLRQLRANGFHFRRQAPFRGYFLDFVCFGHRLVIEVDGAGHAEDIQADHDAVRDRILRHERFHTLRFWNGDINTNLDGVMSTILAELRPSADKKPRKFDDLR